MLVRWHGDMFTLSVSVPPHEQVQLQMKTLTNGHPTPLPHPPTHLFPPPSQSHPSPSREHRRATHRQCKHHTTPPTAYKPAGATYSVRSTITQPEHPYHGLVVRLHLEAANVEAQRSFVSHSS